MTRQPALIVFGATGFVGRHVCSAAANWAGGVTVVTRHAASDVSGTVVRGDIRNADAVVDTLPRGAVVVNLMWDVGGGRQANLAIADAVLDVCVRTAAVRLVHVSTAVVAGRVHERMVTEGTMCHPVTDYEQAKLDVEVRMRERLPGHGELVVLRPTAIFGRGGQNLRKLVSDLTTRPPLENYARACLFGRRPMNLVPVETVAAAILFAASTPRAAADEIYLVADDDAPENNFLDVEAVMRRALGLASRRIAPVPLPSVLRHLILRTAGGASVDPRTRFSSARLAAAGFIRPITFSEALQRHAEVSGDLSVSAGEVPA